MAVVGRIDKKIADEIRFTTETRRARMYTEKRSKKRGVRSEE
jgi:hypothetical protein